MAGTRTHEKRSPMREGQSNEDDLNLSHESKITMTDTGKVIHNSIKAEQAPPAN